MVKKQQQPQLQFCRNKKYCQFKTMKKMEYAKHKTDCLFKKGRSYVFPSKKNFDDINFEVALVGQQIGKGGFGTVSNIKIGSFQMVVKFINQSQKQSYLRQVDSLKQLHKGLQNRKGFPLIFGSVEKKGEGLYIFLEKLEFPLSKFLKHFQNAFSDYMLASMMSLMLDRLQSLHSCGLVHRDLKWNNFMLKNGEIYVIDFGSCLKPPKKARKHTVFGHLAYMGRNGHNFIHQTYIDDIQSLGWLFIEMTTPNLPWQSLCKKDASVQMGMTYDQRTMRVCQMKRYFLQGKQNRTTRNCFAFNFLQEVYKVSYTSQPPTQLYQDLQSVLRGFLKKNNGMNLTWRQWVIPQNKNPCEVFNQLFTSPVPSMIKKFDENSLPIEFLKLYMKRQKLTNLQIYDGVKQGNQKKFNYADLSYDYGTAQFIKIANRNEHTAWLIFSDDQQVGGPHYSVYITLKGRALSFNGLNEPRTIKKFLKSQIFRHVETQADGWSCGYRAIFWLKKVISAPSIEEWLCENEVEL